MRLLRLGASAIENASPLGLVLLGASLAYTLFPAAKKITRATAVLATRGVLTLADTTKELSENIKESVVDIVAEAKIRQTEEPFLAKKENLLNQAKQKQRSLAVAAAGGVLGVAEGVKAFGSNIKEQVDDLVAEAKAKREGTPAEEVPEPDNIESDI